MQRLIASKRAGVKLIPRVEIKQLSDPRAYRRTLFTKILTLEKELAHLKAEHEKRNSISRQETYHEEILPLENELSRLESEAVHRFGGFDKFVKVLGRMRAMQEKRAGRGTVKKSHPEKKPETKQELKPEEHAIFESNLPLREKLEKLAGIEGSLMSRRSELETMHRKAGNETELGIVKSRLRALYDMINELKNELRKGL